MREDLIALLKEAFETGIITTSMQSQIDAVKKSMKLSAADYQKIEDEIRINTYIHKVKERERKGVTFMGDLRKQYKITEDDKLLIEEILKAETANALAAKKIEEMKKPEPAKKTEPKKTEIPPQKTISAPSTFDQSDVVKRSEALKQRPAKMPEETEKPLQHLSETPKDARAPRPLILVADDNETQLMIMKKVLEENNYDCITVEAPEVAVRVIAEKQPALVLCDINFGIGKPTGLDVFTNIRTKNIRVPFVLVSAFIQKEFKDHAKRLGVTEYITKPAETEELLAVIKKYIPQ